MRRTGNTPASPAIGIVVAGTVKMGFGSDWASAGTVCVAAPASANALEARMVLRSTVFMGIFPVLLLLERLSSPASLARQDAVAVKKKARARAGLPELTRGDRSPFDVGWQLATIGSELGHHLLVQPDVHAGGVAGVAGVAKFLRQLLARGKTGMDIARLHQIDDRGPPLQLFALGLDRLVQDGRDIDGLSRRSRCGRRSSAGGRSCRTGGRARSRTAARRCGVRLGTEDRAHDFSENAHHLLPVIA